MSGEKTRKLDTLEKLFQALRRKTMLTRLSDNLPKLEHHAGLKSLADELRKLATANTALLLVLTKKSELNLNDKDGYPQVCIRGATRLDGGRGKKQVWSRDPIFEPEVFRNQMYCIEESTSDMVGTFRRPLYCYPLYLPMLRPLQLTDFLTLSSNLSHLGLFSITIKIS